MKLRPYQNRTVDCVFREWGNVNSTLIDLDAYQRECKMWEQESAQIESVRQKAVGAVLGNGGVP